MGVNHMQVCHVTSNGKEIQWTCKTPHGTVRSVLHRNTVDQQDTAWYCSFCSAQKYSEPGRHRMLLFVLFFTEIQ